MTWQPIATAPQDRPIVISNWRGDRCLFIEGPLEWNETTQRWGRMGVTFTPTHWAELEPPP